MQGPETGVESRSAQQEGQGPRRGALGTGHWAECIQFTRGGSGWGRRGSLFKTTVEIFSCALPSLPLTQENTS